MQLRGWTYFEIVYRCFVTGIQIRIIHVEERTTFVNPEYGGSMDLRNTGILTQHYTASQSTRPGLEISPL